MTTFFTDADVAGVSEFVESEVNLGTEFTIPDGKINRFRWRFGTSHSTDSLPTIRFYTAAGILLATIPFDTYNDEAWNWATPTDPISVTSGSYVVAVNTVRYPATGGFFSSPIVRGNITGVRGRFTSGISFPGNTSTASYFPDIDFVTNTTPSGPTVSIWNGTSEVPASVSVWNGASEVPGTLEIST